MRNFVVVAALAVSACAANPPSGELPHYPGGTCNAEGLARFAGQPATQELGAEMLRVSGARIIRWVSTLR